MTKIDKGIVAAGSSIKIQLTAKTGAAVPDSVTLTMDGDGGFNGKKGDAWNYNSNTGVITINAGANVTGKLTIGGLADVTGDRVNLTTSISQITVSPASAVKSSTVKTITLVAANGYKVPENRDSISSITVGGTPISTTYTCINGVITFTSDVKLTGALLVTLTGSATNYVNIAKLDVSVDETSGAITVTPAKKADSAVKRQYLITDNVAAKTAVDGWGSTAKAASDLAGYGTLANLTDKVTVKDTDAGKYLVVVDVDTGNSNNIISAKCIQIPVVAHVNEAKTVSVSDTANLEVVAPVNGKIMEGDPINKLTIKLSTKTEGYVLPTGEKAITSILHNEKAIDPSYYTYNGATGEITFKEEYTETVKGDIVVYATATQTIDTLQVTASTSGKIEVKQAGSPANRVYRPITEEVWKAIKAEYKGWTKNMTLADLEKGVLNGQNGTFEIESAVLDNGFVKSEFRGEGGKGYAGKYVLVLDTTSGTSGTITKAGVSEEKVEFTETGANVTVTLKLNNASTTLADLTDAGRTPTIALRNKENQSVVRDLTSVPAGTYVLLVDDEVVDGPDVAVSAANASGMENVASGRTLQFQTVTVTGISNTDLTFTAKYNGTTTNVATTVPGKFVVLDGKKIDITVAGDITGDTITWENADADTAAATASVTTVADSTGKDTVKCGVLKKTVGGFALTAGATPAITAGTKGAANESGSFTYYQVAAASADTAETAVAAWKATDTLSGKASDVSGWTAVSDPTTKALTAADNGTLLIAVETNGDGNILAYKVVEVTGITKLGALTVAVASASSVTVQVGGQDASTGAKYKLVDGSFDITTITSSTDTDGDSDWKDNVSALNLSASENGKKVLVVKLMTGGTTVVSVGLSDAISL